MPKHTSKQDITYSSALAESPDLPGRTTGDLDDAVLDIDLEAFDAALEAAVAAGVPFGVLRRHVELREWASAPAVR